MQSQQCLIIALPYWCKWFHFQPGVTQLKALVMWSYPSAVPWETCLLIPKMKTYALAAQCLPLLLHHREKGKSKKTAVSTTKFGSLCTCVPNGNPDPLSFSSRALFIYCYLLFPESADSEVGSSLTTHSMLWHLSSQKQSMNFSVVLVPTAVLYPCFLTTKYLRSLTLHEIWVLTSASSFHPLLSKDAILFRVTDGFHVDKSSWILFVFISTS